MWSGEDTPGLSSIYLENVTLEINVECYWKVTIKRSSNFCLYKISIGDDVIDTYFYLDQLNFVRNASV